MMCIALFQLYFSKCQVRKPTRGLGLGPTRDITARNQVPVTAFALLVLVFTKEHLAACSRIKCVLNSPSQWSEAMPFKVCVEFLEVNIQNTFS